jgi:hypothetical protein
MIVMSNQTTTDEQLFCACGVSYGIGVVSDLSTVAPFYSNAGFTGTPTAIQAALLPQTAACLIGQTAGGIVIAFRGTEFTAISDWATDLLVEPVTAPGFTGTVHAGFYLSVMEIMPAIVSALTPMLAAAPGTTVYITGHSKGGPMASLAAWYLTKVSATLLPANVVVTTFASPAPGDSTFASAYQKIISQTNYVNHLDLVPFLPPSSLVTLGLQLFISEKVTNANLQAFLLALISDFETWGYTAISETIQYIDADGVCTAYSMSDFISNVSTGDLGDIENSLASGDYSDVLKAHTYACGGGYAAAICPGMCPA